MKTKFLFLLAMTFLSSSFSFAVSAELEKRILGTQTIRGELAKVIYNGIQVEPITVSEWGSNRGYTGLIKNVDRLSCGYYPKDSSCHFTDKNGQVQSSIRDEKIARKLFKELDSLSRPMGVDSTGKGSPEGYYKEVADITCQFTFSDASYACQIRFRQ